MVAHQTKKIQFLDIFKQLLEVNECSNKEIIIIGDVNCDVLAQSPTCYTNRLAEITDNHFLTQIITKRTWITKHSKTLIDHIKFYTSSPNKVSYSGVLHPGIGDHCAIYAIIGK